MATYTMGQRFIGGKSQMKRGLLGSKSLHNWFGAHTPRILPLTSAWELASNMAFSMLGQSKRVPNSWSFVLVDIRRSATFLFTRNVTSKHSYFQDDWRNQVLDRERSVEESSKQHLVDQALLL
jgi:hypothetical protein